MNLLFPARTITLEAALTDLRTGTPKARALAAEALGTVGLADRDRTRVALVAALTDDAVVVRAEAAASLGELLADQAADADPDAVAGLIRRLDDGAVMVRQAAAISLGTIRAPAGFAPLVAGLREGPADLRFQAATSICEIDPPAAFDPLRGALEDPDPQVLGAVALSLGATGDPRAAGHLAGLLEHADRAVRFDAAYGLSQLGDPRGTAELVAALTDPARDWDAASALIDLRDPTTAGALFALLGRRKTTPQVRARAAGALLSVDPEGRHASDARAHLIAALRNRRLPVRGVAVEELARVGGHWAVAPLEQLAAHRRGKDLREVVADTLAAIRGRGTPAS